MKKILIYSSAILCMMATVFSCQKAPEVVNPAQEQRLQTFTLSFPEMDGAATKVSNNLGTVGWEEGDQLVFQGCPKDGGASVAPVVHTLTASEITDPKTAVITVDLSSLVKDESTPYEINVAYPAGVWSSYSSSHTYGRSRFTGATNRLLMAGYINGSAIELVHVTAVLFFKVPASLDGLVDSYTIIGKNEEVLGYDKYLVEINNATPNFLAKLGAETYGTLDPVTSLSGPVTADGTTLHAVYFQNEVNFTNGFTIQFKQGGEIKKIISSNAPLHLVHGHGVNLGLLPESYIADYVAPSTHDSSIDMAGATALDGSGNANCYIVDGSVAANAEKVFTFKAYKGNSAVGVGTIASTAILWETYNNAETVTANSVIAAVDFDKQEANDYYTMVFKMPATLHAGNALIAAKDAGGNILWSWHIWVPETSVTADATGVGGMAQAGILDRNLGALVVTSPSAADASIQSAGLMYQWGRKDPFMGPSAFGTNSAATVNGTAKTNVTEQKTEAWTIQNPTVFIAYNGDWSTVVNNDIWADSDDKAKSISDPCPPGYRVPQRKTSLRLWSGTSLVGEASWGLDATHYWFKVGTPNPVVFPIAGYIYKSGGYDQSGTEAYIWTAHKGSDTIAYALRLKSDGTTKNEQPVKASGANVRCVGIAE